MPKYTPHVIAASASYLKDYGRLDDLWGRLSHVKVIFWLNIIVIVYKLHIDIS